MKRGARGTRGCLAPGPGGTRPPAARPARPGPGTYGEAAGGGALLRQGRVQREAPARPVLAGEHHHGGLHGAGGERGAAPRSARLARARRLYTPPPGLMETRLGDTRLQVTRAAGRRTLTVPARLSSRGGTGQRSTGSHPAASRLRAAGPAAAPDGGAGGSRACPGAERLPQPALGLLRAAPSPSPHTCSRRGRGRSAPEPARAARPARPLPPPRHHGTAQSPGSNRLQSVGTASQRTAGAELRHSGVVQRQREMLWGRN